MELFSNDAVTLNTVDMGSAVVLGSITEASVPLETETISPATGDVYDSAIAVVSQKPSLEFATEAVGTLLSAMATPTGLCINSDGSNPGVVLHGQKHDKCATSARVADATAEHVKYTVANGQLMPVSLSASAGANNLTMRSKAYGISTDGSTSPLETDYAVARPSNVISNEMYGLGVPRVNGIYLDQVTSVNVQFNHQMKMESYAGSLYLKMLSVLKTEIVTTITTDDPKIVGATPATQIAMLGVRADNTDTYLQFLKRDTGGGGYIDDATATHLTGYLNGFVTVSGAYKASGTGTAVCDITIKGLYDSAQTLKSPLSWLVTAYDRP